MECRVCGHKHEVWDNENMELLYKDTEPFICIEGVFVAQIRPFEEVKVQLYACPKCNTVQMQTTW